MTDSDKLSGRAWPVFFALSASSGLYFAASLALLPSDGGGGPLGLSARRLVILAPMLLLALALAGACFLYLFRPGWRARWLRWAGSGAFRLAVSLLAAALVIFPQVVLDLLHGLFAGSEEFAYSAYAARLAPLCGWLSLAGLLLGLALLVTWPGGFARPLRVPLPAVIFAALALGMALVAWTGVGLRPDLIGAWGLPTVPLLEWQIGLALLATLLVALALARFAPGNRAGLWISLAVWALAALLWAGHPLVPGYFATPGRAPNFETYPFSDGATYDQYAQSILIGNGFMGAIPQRPLYIVFLAGLHLLAGQDYLKVILLQQLILAIFPVLIYWLGKELHSRPAGLLAALLIILREITAIRAAPFTDNITYSKLYFSEIPTAICLSAFTLLAIRWMKGRGGGWFSLTALAAGGFLGMAMLIRTQSLAVLPPVLLVALFAWGRRGWVGWLRGSAVMALGVVLVIAPWLVRNYPVARGIAFDNADSQTMVLAQRYNNMSFDQVIEREPGESESAYSSRLLRMAVQGMAGDPGGSAWAVANHFINNEISNLLIFPLRIKITSLRELLWPTFAFWQEWAGSLTFAQALLVLANLALIALGLAGAQRFSGPAAWAPLLASLAYNFSTSVFRSSGGRFLIPVDWAVILTYALGWAQVLAWGWALLKRELPPGWALAQPLRARQTAAFPARAAGSLVVAAGFLLVGMSLPLADRAFPARYQPETQAQMLDTMLREMPPENSAALERLAQQPGVVLLHGRALYPRFYKTHENEPKTAKTGYAGLPYARLVFYLVGSQNGVVVLPQEQPPAFFPNTADVYIIGCRDTGMIRAQAVLVMQGERLLYGASSPQCGQK